MQFAKSFTLTVVQDAWQRAGGSCECRRLTCGHIGRCHKQLGWQSRGLETELGWEAHHINRNGPDTLSNCEILCQRCHKNTQTYGN